MAVAAAAAVAAEAARHGAPSSSRRMIRVLVGGYARPIYMPLVAVVVVQLALM